MSRKSRRNRMPAPEPTPPEQLRTLRRKFMDMFKRTLGRLDGVPRVVQGTLFGLFFGLVTLSLQAFGIITMNWGHIFMFLAWLVGSLIITLEIIPGKPGRHKTIYVIGLALVMLIGDLLAAKVGARLRQQEPLPQQKVYIPLPTPRPTDLRPYIYQFAVSKFKDFLVLHLHMEVQNEGDVPSRVITWKGHLKIVGRATLDLNPTFMISDRVERVGSTKENVPFRSQDIMDEAGQNAVSNVRPAIGILSFRLDGITEKELERNDTSMTITVTDKFGQSFTSPPNFIGEQITNPEHIPGMREQILPPKTKH